MLGYPGRGGQTDNTKNSILCMPDTNQITTQVQGKGEWWNTHTHKSISSLVIISEHKIEMYVL